MHRYVTSITGKPYLAIEEIRHKLPLRYGGAKIRMHYGSCYYTHLQFTPEEKV